MRSIEVVEEAADAFCAGSVEALTAPQVLAVLARLETAQRRLAAAGHALIAQLTASSSPVSLGAATFTEVLAERLHISKTAARRRLGDAEQLGPRRALGGASLEPVLPSVAAAARAGLIGDEHVRIIRGFFDHLPVSVDAQTRERAEVQLAAMATRFRPEQLRVGAERIGALLNPDGELTEAERARRRHLTLGAQGPDGMSPISGLLDPETRSYLDALLAKYAAPGTCNPQDQSPGIEPDEAAAQRDTRTPGQRNHDGLKAIARAMLAAGIGNHHGLPVTVIATTTLAELETAAGCAVTGSGARLPMRDLIRMASHAHHYLAIFDDADGCELYLGRTRRIASPEQRIMLHAKDRGCSHPGCTTPGYLCQTHHIDEWIHDNGPTNIDNLTFACGPHHRLITPGGWSTRKNRTTGHTEWIPPPHINPNRPRVNTFHHPELFTTT